MVFINHSKDSIKSLGPRFEPSVLNRIYQFITPPNNFWVWEMGKKTFWSFLIFLSLAGILRASPLTKTRPPRNFSPKKTENEQLQS